MLKTRIVKKTVKIKQLFDYLKIPEKENFVFSSPIMLNVKTPYGYKKIKNLFRTEKQNSVSIYFKNNKVLETSLNHLLLVNGEWKAVKDIDIENDIIETETGHTKIKHIHEKNKDVMLYDMTVEDVQCYYSSGILSHNSWVLMAIGNHALTLGKTVFHYTLELSEVVNIKRYYCAMTKTPVKKLSNNINEIINKIEEYKNNNGTLIIKEYPTKRATVDTLAAHIDMSINNGLKPDMIIVDYGDLLRPSKSYGEKRLDVGSIFEELRGIAVEYDVPVVTATQANRTNLNDREYVRGEDVSEDYSKIMISDFIFSIFKNNSDIGNIYVIKNRFGKDKLLYKTSFNFDEGSVEILNDEGKEPVVDSDKERIKKRYLNKM